VGRKAVRENKRIRKAFVKPQYAGPSTMEFDDDR
jgi:hypothetical protein